VSATLTATWEPSSGSVLLDVLPDGATVAAILRTDANGTRGVRVQTGVLPSAAEIVTRDAEAANGPASYAAVTAAGAVVATGSTTVVLPGWRMHVLVLPAQAAAGGLITAFELDESSTTTLHEVFGRPDPVPSLGPLASPSTTADLWCATWEDAQALRAVLATGEVVMLRQSLWPGADAVGVVDGDVRTKLEVAEGMPDRWVVTVPLRAITVPTDDLRGTAAWTCADVAAAYSTCLVVVQTYDTCADLVAGPVA